MTASNSETDVVSRAMSVSADAAAYGLDWSDPMEVLDKVVEELAEIRQAIRLEESVDRVAEELGDMFFALVSFCRKSGIDPVASFGGAIDKFGRRFEAVRRIMSVTSGGGTGPFGAAELDAAWNRVKEEERNDGR